MKVLKSLLVVMLLFSFICPASAAGPRKQGPAPHASMSAMGQLAQLAQQGKLAGAIAKARTQSAGTTSLSADEPPGPDDEDTAGPAGGQAELSIAVDATGQHIVVGANDTRGFSVSPVSVSGFAYSDDAGVTWTDGGPLPTTVPTVVIGNAAYPQSYGDPEVKYLGGCNFAYFEIAMLPYNNNLGVAQSMGVHLSNDCGHTWKGPYGIPAATNPHGYLYNGSAYDAADKEFAAVNPDTKRVLMTWSNFTSTSLAPGGVEISATYSDDMVAAATNGVAPTWSSRVIIAATTVDGQASFPRFAGNNSPNAYVVWVRYPGTNYGWNQNIGFSKSTDNGATWSAPVSITTDFLTMDQALGNDRSHTMPQLAVDTSTGAHSGNVYVVYANNQNSDGADIAFQRSTDQGATWSTAVFLNSRPGADRAQWYPTITVDNTIGRIYVSYYDQGIATSGDLTETSYTYSDDGGTTWSKPRPLSDIPFKAGWGNDTGQPNLGDYNQAVAQNGHYYVTWAGTKQALFTEPRLNGGSFSTPDMYFKNLPATANGTALRIGHITFTESGSNGYIDVSDTVTLTIPLENYVTNAANKSTVSGVSATLSSTTTGVTVTQATSGYANVAAGSSANNTTAYKLTIGNSFVPGTDINLTLNVTSGEGSSVLQYNLTTGTPTGTIILQENFDSVAPGALPTGWTAAHGAGSTTVPWTTQNTWNGGNNGLFHANGSTYLWERAISPVFSVPADSDYVMLDMDVMYDTEDDPTFNIWAYDGFFLRVTDQTTQTLYSNLAEAFEAQFFTGGIEGYPKHMPRNSNSGYFPNGDMAMWAGTSNGLQHVHMKLMGMAGTRAQLRFEYAQDGAGTCVDVRPSSTVCGVLVDNIVVTSVSVVTPTTLSLTPRSGQMNGSTTLVATVSPASAGAQTATGTVEFTAGTTSLGTAPIDNTGVATLPYTFAGMPGSTTILATFTSTNAKFLGSNATATAMVMQPNYSLSASPMSLTIQQGGSGTATITMTPMYGYNGTVTFGCNGLPAYATCTFSQPQLTGNTANTPVTTVVTITTTRTVATMTPTGSRPVFAFWTLGVGVFGVVLAGVTGRRRGATLMLMVLVLAATLALVGCGSSSTPPPSTTVTGTPIGAASATITASASGGTATAANPNQQVLLTINVTP